MRFFKCAAYVLFLLGVGNLAFNLYMFRELREPNIIVAPNPETKMMHEYSTIRDTQLLQAILMVHHDRGIHEPGKQKMCPLCDAHNMNPDMLVKDE